MTAKFLVFEGLDGSGKGTVIKAVKEIFENRNYPHIFLRDPGSTEIGEEIRNILLNPTYESMFKETELLLYVAARSQMLQEKIIPALNNNINVICDRYDLSTLTYQFVLGHWDSIDSIEKIMSVVGIFDTPPDHYFYLDIDLQTAKKRLGDKLDRQEEKLDRYFLDIKKQYLEFRENNKGRCSIHDATKNQEEVLNDVVCTLNKIMKWN